jgi:hypothetical protein
MYKPFRGDGLGDRQPEQLMDSCKFVDVGIESSDDHARLGGVNMLIVIFSG